MSLNDYDAGLIINKDNIVEFIHCSLNTEYTTIRTEIKTILDGIGPFESLSADEKRICARWNLTTDANALTVLTENELYKYKKFYKLMSVSDDTFEIKDGDMTIDGILNINILKPTNIEPLLNIGDILVQSSTGVSKLDYDNANLILHSNQSAICNIEWINASSLVSNALQVFHGYHSVDIVGLPTSGSFTDLLLDTEIKKDSIYTHTSPESTITIHSDGVYLIYARFTANMTSGTQDALQGKLQINNGGGFVDINGTVSSGYIDIAVVSTSTCNTFTTVTANSGDIVKAQIGMVGTSTCNSSAGMCSLLIYKLESIAGPVGVAGAQGDIMNQGTWVSQNYLENDVVEYIGSSYVCILNTNLKQPPTNNTFWHLIAEKGFTGSNTTINIQDEGIPLGTFTDINHIGLHITGADGTLGMANIAFELESFISSSMRVFNAYFTGSDALATTWFDIPWDIINKKDTVYSHVNNPPSPEITLNTSGYYFIFAKYSGIKLQGDRHQFEGKLQIDTGGGYADIPSTLSRGYMRDSVEISGTSCSTFAFVSAAAGNKIKSRIRNATAAGGRIRPNVCSIMIVKIQSDQGPDGIPGTVGNLNWKKTWVLQDYTINDTVYYQGNAYICTSNTTAAQAPTDTLFWDMVASKGDTGSGSNLTVFDNGMCLGDFSELNLIGSNITATDSGSGLVNIIDLTLTKLTPEIIKVRTPTVSDINLVTAVVLDWTVSDITHATYTLVGGTQIRVNVAGTYRISYSITYTCTVANTQVLTRTRINTINTHGYGSTNYVRTLTNNNTGTSNYMTVLILAANDLIDVTSIREANTGTCIPIYDQCFFIVERLDLPLI